MLEVHASSSQPSVCNTLTCACLTCACLILLQVSHSPYVNGVIDHLKPQHTVNATA